MDDPMLSAHPTSRMGVSFPMTRKEQEELGQLQLGWWPRRWGGSVRCLRVDIWWMTVGVFAVSREDPGEKRKEHQHLSE